MGRQATIDGLPESIRREMETRIRRDGVKPAALVEWLQSEGHSIGYQAVNRYANKIRAKVAGAEAAVEIRAATDRLGTVTGLDIQFDLIDLAKTKLMLALDDFKPDDNDLSAAQLFGAIARVTAVDVQIHKFVAEMKSRVTLEMRSIEGSPGIDLATLKTIRERVYGIFDIDE